MGAVGHSTVICGLATLLRCAQLFMNGEVSILDPFIQWTVSKRERVLCVCVCSCVVTICARGSCFISHLGNPERMVFTGRARRLRSGRGDCAMASEEKNRALGERTCVEAHFLKRHLLLLFLNKTCRLVTALLSYLLSSHTQPLSLSLSLSLSRLWRTWQISLMDHKHIEKHKILVPLA